MSEIIAGEISIPLSGRGNSSSTMCRHHALISFWRNVTIFCHRLYHGFFFPEVTLNPLGHPSIIRGTAINKLDYRLCWLSTSTPPQLHLFKFHTSFKSRPFQLKNRRELKLHFSLYWSIMDSLVRSYLSRHPHSPVLALCLVSILIAVLDILDLVIRV